MVLQTWDRMSFRDVTQFLIILPCLGTNRHQQKEWSVWFHSMRWLVQKRLTFSRVNTQHKCLVDFLHSEDSAVHPGDSAVHLCQQLSHSPTERFSALKELNVLHA